MPTTPLTLEEQVVARMRVEQLVMRGTVEEDVHTVRSLGATAAADQPAADGGDSAAVAGKGKGKARVDGEEVAATPSPGVAGARRGRVLCPQL